MGASTEGRRVSKRGIESRVRFIDVAIEVLAEGAPETVSANLIARRAGLTWGTIQYQFGDVDGVWAAVLEEVLDRMPRPAVPPVLIGGSLRRRVTFIVDSLWAFTATRDQQAVHTLRRALPSDHELLAARFPKTEAVLRRWDLDWRVGWESLFEGLSISRVKLRRVRSLVPGAIEGLRANQQLSKVSDVDAARRGLTDALVAYLS